MDPNANRIEQRAIVSAIQRIIDSMTDDPGNAVSGSVYARELCQLADHAQRLAALSEALDDWIVNGGFLPIAWQPQTRHNPVTAEGAPTR